MSGTVHWTEQIDIPFEDRTDHLHKSHSAPDLRSTPPVEGFLMALTATSYMVSDATTPGPAAQPASTADAKMSSGVRTIWEMSLVVARPTAVLDPGALQHHGGTT